MNNFNSLTTQCRLIVWWWLVFICLPGWAGESKPVPPQNNPGSSTCKIDDQVVEKWKAEVQKFQTMLITRGGNIDISSPLFSSVFSSQNVKILAGRRKIHLAWEGSQKHYQVKIFPSGRPWIWTSQTLQAPQVSSEEKEFKAGESYWVVVTDDQDNESKWKFTVVDLKSQPFSKQFEAIQKDTSLKNEAQRKLRLAILLLSYGEEWKLEAYQQIAELPIKKESKESDEFSWVWSAIKNEVWPPSCRN